MNHFASDHPPSHGDLAHRKGGAGTDESGFDAHRERAIELLAGRALDELSIEESIELDALLIRFPELDDERFELTAASLLVAGVHAETRGAAQSQAHAESQMPGALRARVEQSSRRWIETHPSPTVGSGAGARSGSAPAAAADASRGGGEPGSLGRTPRADSTTAGHRPAGSTPRPSILARLGWPLAVAASIVAAVAWWPREGGADGSGGSEGIGDLRSAVASLREAPGTITVPWAGGEHAQLPAAPRGEVIWNNARQDGFMVIGGLAANDPKALQYQLWIFDAARDDRYPVDGGVFDMPASGGEVIVPIRAALDVSDPALFAVTVEPPGGVVVSARDVVLAATPPR